MNTVKEVRDDFLAESHDDYVGLWSLIWRFENGMGETRPKRIRSLTISLLKELLKQGLIKAGMPNARGEFEEWRDSSDKIIKRIAREWDQLGREPKIGDIVWFTTTEKGDTQVQQRNKLPGSP
jgi:hypothetical protein